MTNKSLVMKFGGSSVGSPDAMFHAVEIIHKIRDDFPQVVVVTSALSGVTDLILDSAANAVSGHMSTVDRTAEGIMSKHKEIADSLIPDDSNRRSLLGEIDSLIDEFKNLCNAVSIIGEASPRALDALASLGERMSVRLLAASIENRGISARYLEATDLIISDDHFQHAHPIIDITNQRIREALNKEFERGKIPVITGFIAATENGITTTLGRGGSDYTAALIAAALPTDMVWIWTDVDGVMTADPRLVPDAQTIAELTYKEVAELAYFGAKVLHPKSIRPVIDAGIGLRVCNTFNPDHPGTNIKESPYSSKHGTIKAVTVIQGQRLITIEGRGMLGVPGVAARTFAAVAATGTSVPLITQASSEQSICFAVPIGAGSRVVSSLEDAFATELSKQDIDRIWASEEVSLITVVGAGIQHTPGISGKVFSALGANNVNVIAIAQGSTEVSISMVVDSLDAESAVQALHKLIISGRN